MGRMRILGLAVVGVFVFAGMVASGASAAPEWKGCVKTEPKDTGKYTDKLCTVESPTSEGRYELAPSVGKGKGFKIKGGPTTLAVVVPFDCCVTLFESGRLHYKCKAMKGEGKLGLPNLIKEAVIEFKGCKLGAALCQTGTKKGVIVTNNLAGEMIDIEGGSGVGSLLEAEGGPTAPLATFNCTEAGTTILRGSVIAEHTGDVGVISKESQEHFVVGEGLGEIEGRPINHPERRIHYSPLVNLPTNGSGGATGERFLSYEFMEVEGTETSPPYPSGLEGAADDKGEALMIVP